MGGPGPQQSSVHHTADLVCPSCETKIMYAHPELRPVWAAIKVKYPDAHISWSYRNKVDQEQAFIEKKTNAHYPYSKHNKVDAMGKPCSHAIDLFQINPTHPKGCWSAEWCKTVYEYISALYPFVTWGGSFKHLSDKDHFEIEIDESGSLVLPAPAYDTPIIIPAKKT